MFSGTLVKLRGYRESDTEKALEYVNEVEVARNLYTDAPFPLTLGDEQKWIASQSKFSKEYNFAIEDLKTGKYIGGCGLKSIDWKNRNVEVGIMIGHPKYRGCGYGTDAMKVLIRFVFTELNMRKIKLNVFDFNKRAICSYEKCGFNTEATLKEELYRDGQYRDVYIMSLFKKDFESL
jgi:RimJ/RimL family protein N-acetyltransferase